MVSGRTAYVSGKMRGLPEYGFPLFDKARDFLVKQGYRVISPADMDRALGFDEKSVEGYDFDVQAALRRDFLAILTDCTDIVMLPNWRESTGAPAELLVAQMIGLYAWQINMLTGDLSPLLTKVRGCLE